MNTPSTEYYEGQELAGLVERTDWKVILPILYAQTRSMILKRFLSDPDKGVMGRTFKDFVHDAVTLFVEGKRKCPKNVRLGLFFLNTIRNLISKHIAKHYNSLPIDATDEQILAAHYESINTKLDFAKVKEVVLQQISKDEICKNIFECWSTDIWKPADIRELFGYSESEYNNAKKRIDRVFADVKKHLEDA